MTRFALIAAPLAIAVSLVLNSGGEDTGLPTHSPTAATPKATGPVNPDPFAAADEEQRAEMNERIEAAPPGLATPRMREVAWKLLASAEGSTLDWRTQYGAIEDSGDGTGYAAGLVGFCSGTHDMLAFVEAFTEDHPDNPLAPFLPALRKVDGTGSHEGLDPGFTAAWKKAAEDPAFRKAQEEVRDKQYFEPAVRLAKLDGLGALGQFIYFDAMVLQGPGHEADSFYGIREATLAEVDTVAEGGDEAAYLDMFLDKARAVMKSKKNQQHDTSRIDTAQRVFLEDENMDLSLPLTWKMYGETFRIP
ncbi:chitosanase [Streptomyces sp. OfavH-34-F]|uniref:chitosanase n=1 Tax=unclassified Streptomyces TaxID=2593676 RepID=UPI001EF16DF4|nr:chitosanase [Streptomyces sp. OfavH-34-F]MCG7526964.1 chitosanase [Streptomyces sp. OfavH-34-F]